jgi:hypothetical protein
MRCAAGIIFYNDKESLKRCLESVSPHLDYIFCIDGKFRSYHATNNLSTDGSRDIVKSYDNTILTDFNGGSESEKRQRYLQLASDYSIDMLLVIDCDEYVKGDFNTLKQNFLGITKFKKESPRSYYLKFYLLTEEKNVYRLLVPRIYSKPHLIRLHKICHNTLFDISKNPPMIIPPPNPPYPIKGIQLFQDNKLRNKQWLEEMFRYKKLKLVSEFLWYFRNISVVKNHIQEYGYNKIEAFLENHPDLARLIKDYTYEKIEYKKDIHNNPELVTFASKVKEYFNSLV